jgi:hypothetical protein
MSETVESRHQLLRLGDSRQASSISEWCPAGLCQKANRAWGVGCHEGFRGVRWVSVHSLITQSDFAEHSTHL